MDERITRILIFLGFPRNSRKKEDIQERKKKNYIKKSNLDSKKKKKNKRTWNLEDRKRKRTDSVTWEDYYWYAPDYNTQIHLEASPFTNRALIPIVIYPAHNAIWNWEIGGKKWKKWTELRKETRRGGDLERKKRRRDNSCTNSYVSSLQCHLKQWNREKKGEK